METYAPLAAPTSSRAVGNALGFGDTSSDEEEDLTGSLQGEENDALIDTGFLSKRTSDKETAAAADESLIRVLESGPNSLEAVKEAAGASKALISGKLVLQVVVFKRNLQIIGHNCCSNWTSDKETAAAADESLNGMLEYGIPGSCEIEPQFFLCF